ncbi:MAG: nucleotidyltransferase domain-containing protein [Butyrivibrio sp.]|nr:nucleotidyltransferase domain-containing protein [Muribaculum sp.]MCM1551182.1 nucleotidyltransferase domain-containing protein [Butyrivibrio sp.]
MLSHEISEELVNGLCGIFGDSIRQIILYGSVVRNEATAESDIDIAIIMDGSLPEDIRDTFIEFSANLDLKYDRVFSIIDIDSSNMEKWGDVLPFYRNLREEGVVLWKAA